MCELPGIRLYLEGRRNVAPGAMYQFVIEREGRRELQDGYWSILIEPKPSGAGFRPHPKFSTFNARSDRLNRAPMWKRCIRSGASSFLHQHFHEWGILPGSERQAFSIYQSDSAIAFAAMYEIWQFETQFVPAFTIVTLPPHPKFSHIRDKSLPLILEPEDFNLRLDPTYH